MKCYIYSFTNLINGKKYIGSTIKTPKKRYNEHIYNCFHENAHQYNYPLYQAIRKYGVENFIFEILLEKDCQENEIRNIEKAKKVALIDENYKIIKIWRSIVDCAEELHIGEKHIAACCRGERHTVDNKIFLWLNNDGNLIIPQYTGVIYKGKKGTTQKQKTNKTVVKYDLNTKKELQRYESVALAARENNCDSSAIIKVCRGQRHKCGGYGWKYEENR